MSLPRLVLATTLFLASAAHASEIALSDPRFGPATGAQARAIGCVASGGGTDLVTWTEEYNAFFPSTWLAYIRTYDAGGAPIQPTQTVIAAGYDAQAVWNGSDYFIAYSRYFSKFGTISPAPGVEAVRVTADGHVIDGSRVSLLETTAGGGNLVALAWDGTHYFAGVTAGGQLKLLLLDREGHVVRSQDGYALSIAALPGGGFVMLRDTVGVGGDLGHLELVRVSRDGELGPPTPLGTATRGQAKIAVNGDRIAVVLQTFTGNVAEELDNDGHVLVSVALPIDASPRSVVWRDSSWVAAYARDTEGCTVRFGSGVATSTICSTTARQPFAGVERAAWIEKSVDVRTSRDLSLAGGEIASVSATMQSDAAAVATDTGSLAAWSEEGAMHIGGVMRDGSRRADYTIDAAEPHHPALATAAAQTLLVYEDGSSIRGLRLDADGRSLAPAFTIGHGGLPSVATDGHEWLVVWQAPDVNPARSQLRAARVTANGDATAEVPVFANGASQSHPSVAWSGVGYVVAWNETESALSGPHTRMMTQLVDRNGARIANALTLADAISGLNFTAASIACGPASCLATWTGDGVFGAVIAPDGTRRSENRLLTRLSPFNVIIASAADGTFRVAYDSLYIFVDASGAPHGNVVWLPNYSTIAGIADGRVFYTRLTNPEELLGNAMRFFAREEPLPPRMRSVAR
jgi:hypothetical protein